MAIGLKEKSRQSKDFFEFTLERVVSRCCSFREAEHLIFQFLLLRRSRYLPVVQFLLTTYYLTLSFRERVRGFILIRVMMSASATVHAATKWSLLIVGRTSANQHNLKLYSARPRLRHSRVVSSDQTTLIDTNSNDSLLPLLSMQLSLATYRTVRRTVPRDSIIFETLRYSLYKTLADFSILLNASRSKSS